MISLGIDTSNYTTSCALYDSETGSVIQKKMLLPVKEGEKGLRQSDAVFHHTRQLNAVISELFSEFTGEIDIIGVSSRPRSIEGSYMPCFTVGLNAASILSSVMKKPLYEFSHQEGHIAAAAFSADRLDLLSSPFIAFHVSGGTTEALLVEPGVENIIRERIIGQTNDLNCGQAIDRCGVMLGLSFPCGAALEELAAGSDKEFTPKISVTDGNCNLSGLENQCEKMLKAGERKEDIAKYCLSFVTGTIRKMTEHCISEYGGLPVLYAGGVMSDRLIKEALSAEFDAFFAAPEFSCDNAAGVAVLSYLKDKNNA